MQPQLRFLLVDLLVDLTGFSEERTRALTDSALANLALLCMNCVRGADAVSALKAIARWHDLWHLVAQAPNSMHALVSLCSYVLAVTTIEKEQLQETLMPSLHNQTQPFISTADRIAAAAHAEGLAQGIQQGIQQGIEQGIEKQRQLVVKVLQRVLETRFGKRMLFMPALDHASIQEIETLIERAVTAASPADIFCEPL